MPRLDVIGNLASTKFLVERLQAPVLAQLVAYLHRELPSAWAFTGSVAMNIHAADLDGRQIRDFGDADVQIDENRFAAFERALADPSSGALLALPAPGGVGGGDMHYRFNGLAVDLVKNKRTTAPGLSEQETVAGIPVLSLAALRRRKMQDSQIGIDPTRAGKARNDLVLLDQLISKRDAALAAPTATAQYSGFAAGPKRKRQPAT